MKRVWDCLCVMLVLLCCFRAECEPIEGQPLLSERTITAELPVERVKRVVELHYNDAKMRQCVDSWQLEASRLEIYAGEPVSFRVKSSRRCDEKSEQAPRAVQAIWTIRGLQGKKASSETITPQSSSYAFSYVFPSVGSYQVTVQNRLDELEVHTISIPIIVTERPIHVVESQVAE